MKGNRGKIGKRQSKQSLPSVAQNDRKERVKSLHMKRQSLDSETDRMNDAFTANSLSKVKNNPLLVGVLSGEEKVMNDNPTTTVVLDKV